MLMIVQDFRVASLLKSNGNRAVVNVHQHGRGLPLPMRKNVQSEDTCIKCASFVDCQTT